MTKAEFLDALRAKLAGLPPEEAAERLAFYNEMITDRMEDGIAEEEAVAELGTVEDVVNQIMSEIPLSTLVRQKVRPRRALKVWEIILLVLGSPVWLPLLIAAFAVGLSLYVAVWAVVVCLWAAVLCLAVGVLWCLIQVFRYQAAANPGGALCAGGAALICAGLAIALFFACKALTKGVILLAKRIILSIKSRIAGKEAAV